MTATLDECKAALGNILSAPKDNVTIDQICFRPYVGGREFPDQLELTVAEGIVGDRWLSDPWLKLPEGSPDPRIQVSILSKRVMDLCWRDQDNLAHHPGDPFVVDMNLGEENLPVGTQLEIGTAVIVVTDKYNSGCVKWNENYGGASLRWINLHENRQHRLRGILCAVVKDGVVKTGDRLRKR
ncbi:MOSC domain-containing protein [Loktanella sp. S4079]|uniref:MOSC domain-containing protein n=1 Tax=Loktanella sp. S4079 TaxID=579483 RepID=UPI0005FA2B8B|nr:hypothetical protein [Loktanella sp. S4079]KJZ20280.1 hypothetical protein TW80_05530 [Loktanella sp. S4079]